MNFYEWRTRLNVKKFFQEIFFTLLIFFMAFPANAAQNIIIEIPEVIYSLEDTIPLGKIAKISGGNLRTRKILSEVQVFSDGEVLLRREVLRAINDSDASDARIELYMPSFSRIETPAYEGNFTETETEKNSSRKLSDLIPIIKNLAAWNGNVEISANSQVPDGELIDPASIVPGTQGVTLRFRDNNGRVKSFPVRLTWLQNVMVASHNLRRGDRITPQDLITRQMKITRPGQFAQSPQEISGFTVNKNIKQGEPILLASLTSSSIIKKGRPVKIIARFGGTSASMDGVLLEDGRAGDWVRVRRADDRRVTLRAKIINENVVEVEVQ